MSRLRDTFKPGQLALFPYLTSGFPDPEQSGQLIKASIDAGADGLEIGVPFSDPMADGATLQRANEQALRNGASILTALHLASWARQASDRVAITFMSYYNPVMAFGDHEFCQTAAQAGADALIVPDLPPEESAPVRAACREAGLEYIYMLGPTSTPERIQMVAGLASGFIYCVALVGVTGARNDMSSELDDFLARVRAATNVPLVVGFGISQPEHVRRLHGQADGVIVASALADLIESTAPERQVAALSHRIRELKEAAGPPAALHS
jgi:tryptophan synthase alpha chain